MAYKKVSELNQATVVHDNDLFLLSDMLGLTSRKLTFATLGQSLNTPDLNGRFQEGSEYLVSRDGEGLVSSISTQFNGITKTLTFVRDSDSIVTAININNSDASYDKTYTILRDENGLVTSISIS